MNVLLISAPSRRNSLVPPMGLLQVGAILESLGHTPRIFDPALDPAADPRSLNFGSLDRILDEFQPEVVGYGGVATSYGSAKQFARHIQDRHPHIKQIAGGPLASVYSLLLTKTPIMAVVHGEAEVSLPLLMERFVQGGTILDIRGISFCDEKGIVVRNEPAPQIQNLDDLPLPAYHLVDLARYFRVMRENIELFKDTLGSETQVQDILNRVGSDNRWIEIMTGRGCTHRCLFCYRHMKGVRYFSVDYVIRHIKYLKEQYGIRGFQFADELFNGDRERVFALCDAIAANGLDIFYIVGGARVDKMDEKMLMRLKETGCIEINYGQESGSDKILKEYRKGTTVQQNKEMTLLTTKKAGMICPVQLVIGSPGETDETIRETIQFLKDVDAYQFSLNYLIPLPETPIWQYVMEHHLVFDVEEYLDAVAAQGGTHLLNLTQVPDRVWGNWNAVMRRELYLHYCRRRGFGWRRMMNLATLTLISSTPQWLKDVLKRMMKSV